MESGVHIPERLAQRKELTEDLRAPASWAFFLELVEKADYRLEYDDGQIISHIAYGSEAHELLVAQMIFLLKSMLGEVDDAFRVYGSNLALQAPGSAQQYFNADCTVVHGKPDQVELSAHMQAVTNPVLLVEVLSAPTYEYDLRHKFKKYKQMPSIQQVLYVDSSEQSVMSYLRKPEEDGWLLQEFSNATDAIPVLEHSSISLAELYRDLA